MKVNVNPLAYETHHAFELLERKKTEENRLITLQIHGMFLDDVYDTEDEMRRKKSIQFCV